MTQLRMKELELTKKIHHAILTQLEEQGLQLRPDLEQQEIDALLRAEMDVALSLAQYAEELTSTKGSS